MTKKIDLNADLGESFGPWSMGADEAMLDVVTSANIACGFHAGDPLVMSNTVRLCKEKGVRIGAHPGFDDLRGFGRRRFANPDSHQLRADIVYQTAALQGIARTMDARVTHVKMHGALGNMASEDAEIARCCIAAVRDLDLALSVVAMATTALQTVAEELGVPLLREIYADRAYNDDGTLVSRSAEGAVLHDAHAAADRVLRMLETHSIESINGVSIEVVPDTVCVHGDNPSAVAMAESLRARLEQSGVVVTGYVNN